MSQNKIGIHNVNNYNSNFDNNICIILIRYNTLISGFLKYFSENIFIKNIDYLNYILVKGIETICHIFKFLNLYTKNLDLVIHNSQRAYIYYIEFIGQIGDDTNSNFLQLNSKDASLFVYKKTIFELNQDFKKDFSLNKSHECDIESINIYLEMYNNLIYKTINKFSSNLPDIINYINQDLNISMQTIINFFIDKNIGSNINNKLLACKIFVCNIKTDNISELLELFLKHIKKYDIIDNEKLEKKILCTKYDINSNKIKYIQSVLD